MGRAARHLLGNACEVVNRVLAEGPQAPVGEKLQTLLEIAAKNGYMRTIHGLAAPE